MVRARTIRPLPTLRDIVESLTPELPRLRERYGIKSLGIFGSYVRGQQHRGSDVDILVEFAEPANGRLSDIFGLQEELGNILGIKVDLGEKKNLKPYIGRHILREVIYLTDPGFEPSKLPASKGGMPLAPPPPRDIRDYLNDILENMSRVEEFVRGTDFAAFTADRLKVYAALHGLMIIGEAVSKLPPTLRSKHPEISWKDIVALRNVVAFGLELPRVWRIIHQDLPLLREQVTSLLAELERQDPDAGAGP